MSITLLSTTPTPASPWLLCHEGFSFAWPGTVTLLHGNPGTHKSRLASLLASVALAGIAGHPLPADSLGFTFQPAPGQQHLVIFVSTATYPDGDWAASLQELIRRAGFPDHALPTTLRFCSLAAAPVAERFYKLAELLKFFRSYHQGQLLLVLDSLTDCCPVDHGLLPSAVQLQHLADGYGATVLTTSYPRGQECPVWACGQVIRVLTFFLPAGAVPTLTCAMSFRATYSQQAQCLVRVTHF